MLLEIRKYIQREGLVSQQQLTREFGMEVSAILPLLEIWIRKGMIRCIPRASCRSSCSQCNVSPVNYYQAIISEE